MPTLSGKKSKKSQDMGVVVAALQATKVRINTLREEEKTLKTDIDEYMDAHVEPNDSGHRVFEFEHADHKFQVKRELRVSTYTEVNAIETLEKELDPKLVSKLVERVPTLRLDVLEQLVANGTVEEEILERILGTKESYATKVKRI